MFESSWSAGLAIVLASGGAWALRAPGLRLARDARCAAQARAVAAARLCLLLFTGWLVLLQVIASSADLSPFLRWLVWGASAALALPWLANVGAGLWLLSPFVHAGPGDTVVACGQTGRITGYGVARLELATEAGWTAHLLYLAVALRPFLIHPRSRAPVLELTFKREQWTVEQLWALRESAILTPFRDLSVPVTVSQQDEVVRVRLALARPEARERMRRCLEGALDEAPGMMADGREAFLGLSGGEFSGTGTGVGE